MAYKTEELEKTAIKAIKEHKLYFIEDVIAFLPCSKPTFYEHKLNEIDLGTGKWIKVGSHFEFEMIYDKFGTLITK